MELSLSRDSAPLRVVVSGLGRMGLRHIQVAHQLGFEVVGLHDIALDALRNAVDGVKRSTTVASGTNLEEVVRNSDADALVIASTANAHFDSILTGVNAGVQYILCEKPFVTNGKQARELVELSKNAGSRIAVNHQWTYNARHQLVRQLINTDLLGHLVSIDVIAGNVGLAMVASHYLHLFRELAPAPEYEVHFWSDKLIEANPRGEQFRDLAGRLMVEAESGAKFYMNLSAQAGHGLMSVYVTEYGRICVDDLTGSVDLSFRKERDRMLPKSRYGVPGIDGRLLANVEDAVEGTGLLWQDFIGQETFSNIEAAAQVVEILCAAEYSAENGGVSAISGDPTTLTRTHRWP